jgi:hypothetical protein
VIKRLFLGVVLTAAALLPASAAQEPAPNAAAAHLEAVLSRSRAPEYRRAGSAGMNKVARYEAATLAAAGYQVVRQNTELGTRYAVDYSQAHEPLLARVDDGHRFKVDSTFGSTAPTSPDGVTCTVKAIADVTAGDCGFVPFSTASPEWKNAPNYDPTGAVEQIIAKGGVGAVIQGDVARNAVMALTVRRPLPSVVAVLEPGDVIDRQVQLRAMGGPVPLTVRNVVGVRRGPAGANRYVLMLAHADGWYQAAADNGGGVAAVRRAAALLSTSSPGVGVAVALVDGEEIGLLGSQHLAGVLSSPEGLALPDGGPPLRMGDLAAVINLDASSARASDVQEPVHAAVGRDAPVFSWRTMVFSEHATLPGLFLGTFSEHGVLGLPVSSQGAIAINGSWRTDAKWFHEAGVPVAWPAVGYPEYHTDADTLDAVDAADLEAVAEAAAELVPRLGAMPTTPILQ